MELGFELSALWLWARCLNLKFIAILAQIILWWRRLSCAFIVRYSAASLATPYLVSESNRSHPLCENPKMSPDIVICSLKAKGILAWITLVKGVWHWEGCSCSHFSVPRLQAPMPTITLFPLSSSDGEEQGAGELTCASLQASALGLRQEFHSHLPEMFSFLPLS